jgi:hypothetical protein
LGFDEKTDLVAAGLLIDPGFTGQVSIFSEARDSGGRKLWLLSFGLWALGFLHGSDYNKSDKSLTDHKGKPALPVYILTPTGGSIATILPNQERTAIDRLLVGLGQKLPEVEFFKFARERDDQTFQIVGKVGPTRQPYLDDVADSGKPV